MIKKTTVLLLFLSLLTFALHSQGKNKTKYKLKSGDIFFQSSNFSSIVFAIEGTTKSPYSHCGILTKKQNKWYICEAVGPVKLTPLKTWIRRGRGKKVDIYRLQDQYLNKVPLFINEVKKYLGKPYDIKFRFDDQKIYCSELIFKGFRKAYKENLGRVVRLGDLDWKPYEALIRKIDPSLPLKRAMITPKHLAEAKQLTQVYKSIDPSSYLGVKY